MLDGKECRTCKAKKPFATYHKCSNNPDGLQYSCKPCRNASRRAAYAKNPEREKARQKKIRDTSVQKRAARKLINSSKILGLIEHPDHCQLCGVVGAVEGHHPDYDEPHTVIWLCRPCHLRHHHQEQIVQKTRHLEPRGRLGRQVMGALRDIHENYTTLQKRTLSKSVRIPDSGRGLSGNKDGA